MANSYLLLEARAEARKHRNSGEIVARLWRHGESIGLVKRP